MPIGTVLRSKKQKCTKLVRFSGFLVLLSRFVVGGQGIIPARGWIQEERLGWIQGGSVLEGGQPQLLTRRPQGFDVFDLCFDFGKVTHSVDVG